MCVKAIDFSYFYDLDCGIVPTVWYCWFLTYSVISDNTCQLVLDPVKQVLSVVVGVNMVTRSFRTTIISTCNIHLRG